ncbi:MAG: Lrp/AsnC family transcriptional regulator [Candidatus Lokiarchaeota archaeon]|nr:Lrp/AsnC family transcriptional regulator [Candidatus Lokiarchaeota archaeon]
MTKKNKIELNLSDIDLKILKLLQKDGRIPISDIHKQTGIAESTIIYHLKKLHSNSIIKGYIPILDFNKLGWNVFSHVGIEVEPDKIMPVCEKLKSYDQISEVLESAGKFDIIATIYSKNLESLSEFLDQQIRKIPGVKEINVTPILKIHKFKNFEYPKE